MYETDSPQREKAVPRLIRDLTDIASRLSKQGQDLENRLENGLRQADNVPHHKDPDAVKPGNLCLYEEQLSGILGELACLERKLDSLLGRLEV